MAKRNNKFPKKDIGKLSACAKKDIEKALACVSEENSLHTDNIAGLFTELQRDKAFVRASDDPDFSIYERCLRAKGLVLSRGYIQPMFGASETFTPACFSGDEMKEIIASFEELMRAFVSRESTVKQGKLKRISKNERNKDALSPIIKEIVSKSPDISSQQLINELNCYKNHGIDDITKEEIVIGPESFPISGLKDRLYKEKKKKNKEKKDESL